MTYSDAQKKANLKWNYENKEYMHDFILNNSKAYKDRNRYSINLKNREKLHFKKECERLRNILLEKIEKPRKLSVLEKIDLL